MKFNEESWRVKYVKVIYNFNTIDKKAVGRIRVVEWRTISGKLHFKIFINIKVKNVVDVLPNYEN